MITVYKFLEKVSKGHYKMYHKEHVFHIAHDKDVEGENKWNIWCDTLEVDQYMDTLWYTLDEAVRMIESEI